MPRITNIRHMTDRDRVWIYIDRDFCKSVRSRTFSGMGLEIGTEINCEQVDFLENFHFKIQYQGSWAQEQCRIEQVTAAIASVDPNLAIHVVGFGADTLEFIPEHPNESGAPDLALTLPNGGPLVARIEVTGTENMRGNDYWIRPDKLKYAARHPEEHVWVALHYQEPAENIIWVQPNPNREYQVTEQDIRGTIEHYVLFPPDDPDVRTAAQFSDWLRNRTNQLRQH